MRAITVIQADLDVGAQGLPALLREDLVGEPVLRRTVARVAKATLPETCVVMAASDEAGREIETMLDGLPAEVCTVSGADLPHRGVLRASRRWSWNNWRGGIGGTTVFDEQATPARLREVMKQTGADALVEVSPAAALIESETIDGLLRWVVTQGATSAFYFAHLPPGLTCALYSQPILDQLVAERTTIHGAMAYHPGVDERDVIEGKSCFPGDDVLRTTPFRLSADSPRTLRRLRAVYDDDTITAVKRLNSSPALWAGALPEEIAVDIADAPDEADPYRSLSGATEMTRFMAPEVFVNAVKDLGCVGDVNVTLGVWGDPLAHPRLFDFITAAREAGAAGIHIATSTRWLDEETVEGLAAADLDAISIRLWGNSEETFERVTGRRDFARGTALVERLLERRAALKRSVPFVIPEMMKSVESVGDVEGFFDRWYGRADWPVIRGYNNFAGQVSDRDVLHPYPGVRFACRQLFSRLTVTAAGEAVVCGQDFRGTHVLGSVVERDMGSLWHDETLERLRRSHAAGKYDAFALCPQCRHWYQF